MPEFPWEPHLHPDERPFARRAARWCESAVDGRRPVLTDFLDPRKQQIVAMVAGPSGGAVVESWGGYEGAERRRMWIAPELLRPGPEDWRIAFLRLRAKGTELSHGDVLGALLGLGIKRDKIGDLSVSGAIADCVVDADLAPYLLAHLQRVGRAEVRADRIPAEAFRPPEESWREERLTVPSLRLDALLKSLLRLSRSEAADRIRRGTVQVNWAPAEDADREVAEGDLLSVRGWGRFKILEIEGQSRRGRIVVRVGRTR